MLRKVSPPIPKNNNTPTKFCVVKKELLFFLIGFDVGFYKKRANWSKKMYGLFFFDTSTSDSFKIYKKFDVTLQMGPKPCEWI